MGFKKFFLVFQDFIHPPYRDIKTFNVFCGPRIQPGNKEAIKNLARYIIRASFSQESPPWCDPFVYIRF